MYEHLLKNAIDLHMHVGPSVAKRSEDAMTAYEEAHAAGYRAYLVKDHYFPSVLGTKMINDHLSDGSTLALGCLCLNNSVGGINLHAVDVACRMGAKIIYMPTVSSANHIEQHKTVAFVGAGKSSVAEKPLYYLDDNGRLLPEVVDVLKYLAAEHPEVVLATGHGTVKEIDALLQKAFELGVKKVLVNHPHFHIGVTLDDVHTNATVDDMVRWADMGAYIELNAVVFDEIFPAPEHLPISLAREMIDKVGAERMILDSDLGQSKWPVPVKGTLAFITGLIELCGVTEEQIVTMFHRNPAKLIDMPVVD